MVARPFIIKRQTFSYIQKLYSGILHNLICNSQAFSIRQVGHLGGAIDNNIHVRLLDIAVSYSRINE